MRAGILVFVEQRDGEIRKASEQDHPLAKRYADSVAKRRAEFDPRARALEKWQRQVDRAKSKGKPSARMCHSSPTLVLPACNSAPMSVVNFSER